MNRKDIYYEGRIYIGHNGKDGLLNQNLTSYPLIGEHNFKDGQEVIFRKDYVLQCQWYSRVSDRWDNCTDDQYDAVAEEAARRIVALPLSVKERGFTIINPPVKEEGIQGEGVKTAMQQLINDIDHTLELVDRGLSYPAAISNIKSMAALRLIRERQQIENAYNQGDSDRDNQQDSNGRDFKNCMDYFTQTYPR